MGTSLHRFLVAVVLAYAARTCLMLVLAWEAMRVNDMVGAPAIVLVAWSVTEIGAGPVAGAVVDRLTPSRALWLSEAAVALIVLLFALLRYLAVSESIGLLVAVAVCCAFLGSASNPAMHGVSRGFATPQTVTVVASRTASAGALGFILGYSAGGFLLQKIALSWTLVLCAASSLSVAFAAPRSPKREDTSQVSASRGTKILDGLRLFHSDRSLRDIAIGFALAYAIFHVVTALLPPFGKLVLHLDSAQFGMLRALWSVGSLTGSVLLSALVGGRRVTPRGKYVLLSVFGLVFALFSLSHSYAVALVLIAASGVVFAICRSVLDAAVFEASTPSTIGRIRGNISSLISLVGLLMFVSSIALSASTIRYAFAAIGVAVLLVSVLRHWQSSAASTVDAAQADPASAKT